MVSSTVTNHEEDVLESVKTTPPQGIASGDYLLVGWDMDATGKRLLDEICQIAAYTPTSTYSQYVMPFKNLNPPAKKRHRIKVVTMGRYRVLKNSITNKVVPTKSEISALTEFLSWLEKVKGDAADGVILVHHEPRKVNPSMLIESLKKYNLLDRFKETVKGFANGFDIAKAKCQNSPKGFSLRILSRALLDQEDELNSAAERARLSLQLVQYLSAGEELAMDKRTIDEAKNEEIVGCSDGNSKSDASNKATFELIKEFIQPMSVEEKEYAELKVILGIQSSLKPIFDPLLGMARRERQHASRLRRLLAEAAVDYLTLQTAWKNGMREGIEQIVKEKVKTDEDELDELIDVIERHFNPEIQPPVTPEDDKKKIKKVRSEEKKKRIFEDEKSAIEEDKENSKSDCVTVSPDTTTILDTSATKIRDASPESAKVDNN